MQETNTITQVERIQMGIRVIDEMGRTLKLLAASLSAFRSSLSLPDQCVTRDDISIADMKQLQSLSSENMQRIIRWIPPAVADEIAQTTAATPEQEANVTYNVVRRQLLKISDDLRAVVTSHPPKVIVETEGGN